MNDFRLTDTEWRRVHPVTPLINSWVILVALAAAATNSIQNSGLFALAGELSSSGKAWILWLVIIVGAVLILGAVLLISLLQWRCTRYAVTDEAVLFHAGILFKKERHMRLNRIQAVDVVASLVPRVFGLAKLHVDSAGGDDSQIDIAYLKVDQCQELRAEVLAKVAGVKLQERELSNSQQGCGEGTETEKKLSKLPDKLLSQVGSAGVVGDLPVAQLQAPEIPLYQIPIPMLIGSILRSTSIWVFVLAIPLLLIAGLLPFFSSLWNGDSDSATGIIVAAPGALIGIAGVIITTVSAVIQQLNRGWNFTAAVSPDGIRLRHGLTTHDSQTIPPGRVHAVELTQPLLWRRKDWWRVELTMAGYLGKSKEKNTTSSILLPVGTKTQALQALWMMEKDLGVVTDEDGKEIGTAGTELISTLMYDSGSAPGLFVPPHRARWLDWITWNRKATVLTNTMVMIRNGRITRRVSFIPHARLQSVAIDQGPLERVLSLANVRLHLVPGLVPTVVAHLDCPLAQRLWGLEVKHADTARDLEQPEEWMKRVTASLGSSSNETGLASNLESSKTEMDDLTP